MSRPANPSWTVGSWATDVNYAPGSDPWNSNPIKVSHPAPAGGFVPNQGAAAEYFNYEFNRLYQTQVAEKAYSQTLVDYVGQLPALNFLTGAAPGGAYNNAFYDKTRGTWVIFGNALNARTSVDFGLTWVSQTLSGTSVHCIGGATDNLSNSSWVLSTSDIYGYVFSAGVWTRVNVFSVLSNATSSVVAYDPVRALWCISADAPLSGTMLVRTSADRTTWTSRTPPTMPAFNGPLAMEVNPSTGRIVLARFRPSTSPISVFISYSDDGGITWSTTAQKTVSAGPTAKPYVCYNSTTQRWLVSVGSSVLESTDNGATWADKVVLSASSILGIAPVGSLLVAGSSSRVVYSLDGGATWRETGITPSGSVIGAFYGGGGVLVLTSDHAYVSARGGQSDAPLLT